MLVSDLHLRCEQCYEIILFSCTYEKYTFKSADLHVNKYNHTWLPIELGFMLNLSLKNNAKERFISNWEMGKILHTVVEREYKNVTIEGNGKILSGKHPYASRV